MDHRPTKSLFACSPLDNVEFGYGNTCQQQVSPRSRDKRAALLSLLATPRARLKPACVALPTRLQF